MVKAIFMVSLQSFVKRKWIINIFFPGKFVLSSSDDNKLVVYSLHGELLKTVEPKLNVLYEALVTPDGRFIAASGFTPDVFVFEVHFLKGVGKSDFLNCQFVTITVH